MPRITFDGPQGPEALEIGWNMQTGQLRFMLSEARHIQRVADLTVDQVRDLVFMDDDVTDPVALTALVQVLWKRQGRIVSFDEVDFDLGSVAFDLLPDEKEFVDRKVQEQAEESADAADPTQTPSGPQPTEG